jgi:uncharacterized membrane protein
MAAFPKTLKELCTPALLYFIISVLALLVLLFQNLGDNSSYNVGTYSCRVPNTAVVFIIQLISIITMPTTSKRRDILPLTI